MKAICVRQPWASLIAAGVKTVEVRSWNAHYRGPLVIVASGTRAVSEDGRAAEARYGLDDDALPRGAALCVVQMQDSRPMRPDDAEAACCPFDAEAFAWVEAEVRAFPKPIPMPGQLSFFRPRSRIVKAAEELLEGRSVTLPS